MIRLSRIFRHFLFPVGCMLAGLALAGCSPVGLVIGAGASVANTATEDRGLDGASSDTMIDSTVRGALGREGYGYFSDVNVTVRERRVLLSGFVRSENDRKKLVEAASKSDGVAEVIDALRVGPSPEMSDSARDKLIEQEISAGLLFDGNVKSNNYIAESSQRVVFLMGVAQSQAELNRVIARARNTDFVRAVFSFVLMKNDPKRVGPNETVTSVTITRPQGIPGPLVRSESDSPAAKENR